MKSFGTDFILVNDIRQRFKDINGTEWLHLGTVKRGLKEYVCFKRPGEKKCYIEEIKSDGFYTIEDENEFQDLYKFLLTNGVLLISGVDKEIKMAK